MKLLFSPAALTTALFASRVIADASEAYNVAYHELEAIHDLTDNLTEAIKAWDGTSLQASLNNIHNPSVSTTTYIAEAAERLLEHRQTQFDKVQSFKIGSPSQRLAYAVNASIASLISRKGAFDDLHASPIVVQDVAGLLSASRNFSEALVYLVPDLLQPVANNLKAQTLDSLQQGVDCFNGTDFACHAGTVDTERTYDLAVRYNAMKPDGSPFV